MRAITIALMLTGCATQPDIAPGRIVSNNPCVDAVLAEIAEPLAIGAVSSWSHDQASASAPVAWARQFPGIGASAEELIAARPRLVLAGSILAPGTAEALRRAGIPIRTFGVPVSVDDSIAQVRAIASAIGRQRAGEALATRIDQVAKPVIRAQRPSAIIWQGGGFVPGRGTLQDEMLARAGFRNASTQYGLNQWDALPIETLIRNPPDIVFTPVDAQGESGRAIATRLTLLTRHSSRTRIVAFPDRLLLCGGPSIVAAMAIMKSAA